MVGERQERGHPCYGSEHSVYKCFIIHRVTTESDSQSGMLRGMASSEMLRRVALVRTDVWVELSISINRVTRIAACLSC
jgi:hypothetical protein